MEGIKICIIGLGYVGLPLAALFSTKYEVIGFDIKELRIKELMSGHDYTNEVENISDYKINFTTDPERIREADYIIVTVPTPIDKAKNPDLTPIIKATETVGKNLKRGAIIIYESTVYPGCTEEICIPVLEKFSGLKLGVGFRMGYSPERVNPGDKEHTIDKIIKVVSGSDEDALNKVADLYGSVIPAGIHRASSIKVAEAAKVIENVKRDLNIALVNELSLIFERMGIDTREVLAAASTKWNFNSSQFFPGLVGGHCIGVDPYYLTHKALELGYHPQVILAGRATNEYMSRHVADLIIKNLVNKRKILVDCNILIMGLTFKENVPDIRNSKALDIINYLKEFNIKIYGHDPFLNNKEIENEFKIEGIDFYNTDIKFDAIVVFSPHKQFSQILYEDFKKVSRDDLVIIDIKKCLDGKEVTERGFIYKTL